MSRSAPIGCLDISGPCTSSENLGKIRPWFYITVITISFAILGLGIATVVLANTKTPTSLYIANGSLGIVFSVYSIWLCVFFYGQFEALTHITAVLEDLLPSIEMANNFSYVHRDVRDLISFEGQWSAHRDYLVMLRKFMWEIQKLLWAAVLCLMLLLIGLCCIQTEQFIAALVINSICTATFLYSQWQFSLMGLCPISSDINSLGLDTTNAASPFYDELATPTKDFYNVISDFFFRALYFLLQVACMTLFVLSLLYLTEE